MQWEQVALMNYVCDSTGGAKSWSRGWKMAWDSTLLEDNTYKATHPVRTSSVPYELENRVSAWEWEASCLLISYLHV